MRINVIYRISPMFWLNHCFILPAWLILTTHEDLTWCPADGEYYCCKGAAQTGCIGVHKCVSSPGLLACARLANHTVPPHIEQKCLHIFTTHSQHIYSFYKRASAVAPLYRFVTVNSTPYSTFNKPRHSSQLSTSRCSATPSTTTLNRRSLLQYTTV
jgi:hypothetical protein